MARHNYLIPGAGGGPWDNPDGSVADQTSLNIVYTNGKVGVGIDDPQRPLHVDRALRLSRGTDSTAFVFDRWNGDINTTWAAAGFFLESQGPGQGKFFIANYQQNVTGSPNPGTALAIDLATNQMEFAQYGVGAFDAIPARFLGVESDGDLVEIAPVQVYVETFAGGSDDGTTQGWTRNSTVVRTVAGRWTVTFATPHPDGTDYHVTATAEESAADRDTPDITMVQGSKSSTGFQIQITTGDNGPGADVLVDSPWTFGVCAPVAVPTA